MYVIEKVKSWENAVTGSLTCREALAVPQSRGLQGDAGVQPQSACFLKKQPRSSTGILKSFDLRERVLWKQTHMKPKDFPVGSIPSRGTNSLYATGVVRK